MDVKFIEYEDKDKDMLLELANKLEEFAKSLDPIKRVKNSPGFIESSVAETLENVKKYQGKIWLAIDDEKTVGYIVGVIWEQSEMNKLEIGERKLGQVTDIYLEENYRGQGLGKKMLQMMENYFRGKSCDSMWVQVFAPNENAHHVYQNFGFMDREIGMLKQIN